METERGKQGEEEKGLHVYVCVCWAKQGTTHIFKCFIVILNIFQTLTSHVHGMRNFKIKTLKVDSIKMELFKVKKVKLVAEGSQI